MQNQITIFCDGASKGNPGTGGWGSVVVSENKVKELGGHEKNTTNNRMELTAAIKGLESASVKGGEVNLYTDSRYLINGITKWVTGWQRNGWKTKKPKKDTEDEFEDVLNKDLWEKLLAAIEGETVKWNYVGGHIGVAGNERCDEIASDFASGETVGLYNGTLDNYEINVLDLGHDDAKKALKKSSSSRKSNSKVKAYSYVSLIKGVLYKDQTWAECEKRVKGVSGTKYQKAISLEHEKEIIKSWGL